MKNKKCTKCKTEKQIVCTLGIVKQYWVIHKGKRKEHRKQYNLIHKEQRREYNKQYWFVRKEELKERNKQYQFTHKKELREYWKQYRQTPKGKSARKNRWHKRRTAYQRTDITTSWLLELYNKATYCSCRVEMTNIPYLPNSKHLDHIIPLNIGGTHMMNNVRFLCLTCNLTRPKDGSDLIQEQTPLLTNII